MPDDQNPQKNEGQVIGEMFDASNVQMPAEPAGGVVNQPASHQGGFTPTNVQTPAEPPAPTPHESPGHNNGFTSTNIQQPAPPPPTDTENRDE